MINALSAKDRMLERVTHAEAGGGDGALDGWSGTATRGVIYTEAGRV